MVVQSSIGRTLKCSLTVNCFGPRPAAYEISAGKGNICASGQRCSQVFNLESESSLKSFNG